MAGFIIIDDGRGIAPARWGYDCIVEAIAEALPNDPDGESLKSWMLDQRCAIHGYGTVDVRGLTLRNQDLFWKAARRAFARAKLEGAVGWHDPSFFPGWLRIFQNLLRMHKLYLRGQPCNPYFRELMPFGGYDGPGWEPPNQQESAH